MNIYLINSSSFNLINKDIHNIVKDNEYISFDLNNQELKQVFEEASYFSFDNSHKYIIVKNCKLFSSKSKNEAEEKLFNNVLDNKIDNTTIIFISDSVDSRKKIVKTIKEKYNFINYQIDYKNIYEYINNFISESKFKVDYKIVGYLVKLYGLNIDLILSELNKIFIYYDNPCTIDYNKSLEIISRPADDNSFHFIDAVVNKEVEKIYKLKSDMKTYKIDASMLLILLAREFRLIYQVKKMYSKDNNLPSLSKKLKMQEWQVNKVYKESLNYTEKEILSIIKQIAIFDEQLKKGIIDKDNALNLIILDIIT